MRLLLDSNALIWFIGHAPQLGGDALSAIAAGDNDVFVSAASLWEIEIKRASGKLRIEGDVAEKALEAAMHPLDITFTHARVAGRLPRIHGDPFDRMLIAQAQTEGLSIVTSDRIFARYAVSVLPA